MDSGRPVHIHYQPGEAMRFSRLVLWSSFVKTMRQLCLTFSLTKTNDIGQEKAF